MLENIPLALSSLSGALNIGKALVNIRDTALLQAEIVKFNNAIIQAQDHIRAAQINEISLVTEINELKQQLVEFKDWSSKRQNHTLTEIGQGVFAYINNSSMSEFQSAHKFCSNCFNKSVESVLQKSDEPKRMIGLNCPNGCNKIVFRHYLSPNVN